MIKMTSVSITKNTYTCVIVKEIFVSDQMTVAYYSTLNGCKCDCKQNPQQSMIKTVHDVNN